MKKKEHLDYISHSDAKYIHIIIYVSIFIKI